MNVLLLQLYHDTIQYSCVHLFLLDVTTYMKKEVLIMSPFSRMIHLLRLID